MRHHTGSSHLQIRWEYNFYKECKKCWMNTNFIRELFFDSSWLAAISLCHFDRFSVERDASLPYVYGMEGWGFTSSIHPKRMSPWRFSFSIEQAADLLDLEAKFLDSYVVICL